MILALAQINSTIGDFRANREKITAFTRRAAECDADIVLFPELAVCGYPPMDLLDQSCFIEQNVQAVEVLKKELLPEIAAGIGFVNRSPYSHGKSLVNEYGIIQNGELIFEQHKTLLPTYDVFDEARNFEPARSWNVFELKPAAPLPALLGFAICEDVWRETDIPGTSYPIDPVQKLLDAGAEMICIPSASPFVAGKHIVRSALAQKISQRGNVPVVYINAVGANDQIIFDGRSFIVSKTGSVVGAKAFEEDLLIVSV
ncbi:MAG: hypothetical protein LBN39_03525 [Planctomycetaceae bacterium]|jgi:NAD+ synthase (glutamine-hydrolysing)|nr:hypothetical protein [Planctomycetaceae bacterium]